ncbi:MAG: DUF58 domain-containing protein [Lachnospiraceae bacterium]|jgi:hypothetical protein|nr:DUF58 domain-containing protein [Lachnospiraceae bacterium]MDD4526135.1 DUF58 domain-containing protein [Lachnospiraceae bacterium]
MVMLWTFPVLFFLFLLEKFIFTKLWDRNLSVDISFDRGETVEGENCLLKETVTNGKFLPLPVFRVGFQVGSGLDVSNGSNVTTTDKTNVIDVFSLRRFERITRTLDVDCRKRGFYTILRTSIESSDLTGGVSFYKNIKQNTEMYVFPHFVNPIELETALEQLTGSVVSKRFLYEDVFTFRGIRDYVPTDNISSINWKASARTGSPMVNLHEPTSGKEVVILLNVEEPAIRYDSDLLEYDIRLALTIAVNLVNDHIPVGIRSNGRDTISGATLEIEPGSSREHTKRIAMGLSRINLLKPKADFPEMIRGERIWNRSSGACNSSNVTYCIISSSQRDDTIESISQLADETGGVFWFCPLNKDMVVKVEDKTGRLNFRRITL